MIMDVVYAPHYTVIAAIVLLIVPVVFHLVAFRKSRRFLHVLTSILVGNFILAFVEEVSRILTANVLISMKKGEVPLWLFSALEKHEY